MTILHLLLLRLRCPLIHRYEFRSLPDSSRRHFQLSLAARAGGLGCEAECLQPTVTQTTNALQRLAYAWKVSALATRWRKQPRSACR